MPTEALELGPGRWVWRAFIIATFLVIVATAAVLMTRDTASSASVEQVHRLLDRQDCVAHINASFFGHLADALSKEPASTQRQDFLDQMKSDATALNHLDVSCPG